MGYRLHVISLVITTLLVDAKSGEHVESTAVYVDQRRIIIGTAHLDLDCVI